MAEYFSPADLHQRSHLTVQGGFWFGYPAHEEQREGHDTSREELLSI